MANLCQVLPASAAGPQAIQGNSFRKCSKKLRIKGATSQRCYSYNFCVGSSGIPSNSRQWHGWVVRCQLLRLLRFICYQVLMLKLLKCPHGPGRSL